MNEIENQILKCNKFLGNIQTNASQDKIREMALAESLKDMKRLLKIDGPMIYLIHLVDTQQLSSFTEQTHLILAIKNVIEKCQTIDDIADLNKLSEEQKKHLDKYLKILKDVAEINENETIDQLCQRIIFENRTELNQSYIEKARIKITKYVSEKCMLEKSLLLRIAQKSKF